MNRYFLVVLLAVLTAGASDRLNAQSNPSVGNWKLNVAKSTYNPGPPPKSQSSRIESVGEGVKNTTEGVAAEGSRIFYSYTANYDGKAAAITGAGPNGSDSIVLKRVDANTFESTLTKGGKVVETTRTVYSKDGKLRTITAKGTTESGKQMNNVSVYERQ
jgi:hypothetical protein